MHSKHHFQYLKYGFLEDMKHLFTEDLLFYSGSVTVY